MRPGLVLIVLAATTSLAGCPRCPRGELWAPSVSSIEGGLEVVSEYGSYTYTLTATYGNGEECLVRSAGAIVDEDDLDGRVRSLVSIDCQTSLVPPLLVTLPDLRSTELSDAPVSMSADVSIGSDCIAEAADLPIDLTVLDAAGGPDAEPQLVTADYRREVDSTLAIEAGELSGTRTDGTACVTQVPAMTLELHVSATSADFDGRRGGGCG